MKRRSLLACLAALLPALLTALQAMLLTPPVHAAVIAPLPIAAGIPGAARVPPNLLLNLAIGEEAAAAAYPGNDDYSGAREYAGYFDVRSCYAYPYKHQAGGLPDAPDLSEASGYFSVLKPADARRECGGDSFSGNFMNWASAATLDIVRYGLSGGDRVIDRATLTVLQRAWLPERAPNADFYAHPRYFPRKRIGTGSAASPHAVTPFAVPLLYVVSCRNRILFSDTAGGGNCDTPRTGGKPAALLKSDKRYGEFLARVQVCDRVEGPRRPDLCLAFGANYKPSGLLQRYAGALRLGLFSYPTEHGLGEPNLYGGLLRAPLDFIGATRRDGPAFAAVSNEKREWRESNGVLLANPRPGGGAGGDTAVASGLLNYLNQVGRVGAYTGRYKIAEPLSELYYEALRYLQGRQPSTGAPAWRSDAGFPVTARWSDPLVASCQRTRFLTIASAATAGDRYVPGNTRSDYLDAVRAADSFASLAPFNVMDWTRRVGAMEADAAGLYGNPAPRTGLAGLDMMNTGDAGHGTYYVAGLAYWAHTQPLRADAPALRIGHSVVALGTDHGGGVGGDPRDSQLYLAAKYGGFADDGEDGNPFDAGVGAGVGRTALAPASQPPSYAAGDDPAVLLAGLRAAFAAAAAGASGAGTSLMVPPDGDEGGYLFQSIGSGDGSARLVRRAFDTGADGVPQTGALLWQARLPVATQRKIFTLGVAAGREGATVPFEWAALTEAQRDLLDRPPAATSGTASASSMLPARDGLGEARLNAVRAGPLGESPHAAPLLVGAPSRTVQGAAYAAYYLAAQARRRVVYLGANDGMLHAFDAAGGAELFAYVPNALMGSLNVLAGDAGISASGGGGGAADTGGTVGGDTSAVASGVGARPAYVDGAAGAGEAQIGGLWKSVVVSGMGGGAQGVFALDAGDPEYFGTATGALWEFTDADDSAIGNVLAAPQIARLNTAAAGKLPVYRYFAVVASGLNNYVDDGKGRYTSGGDGALFLLALDKAPAAAWARGVNYYKFSAPMTEPGAVNGLGPPALVAGVDGALRFAYAGDLQGNLWRFDFGGAAPWSRAAGKAIFVARDDDGRRQPITARPAVVFAAGGAYQILFGTGQWIADADADDNRPQSFYAIRDAPDNTAGVSGRDALAKRTLAAAAGAGPRPGQGQGASATLILSGDAFRYTGLAAKQGWYLDFLDGASSGERSVGDSTLAAGKVFFNTLLPGGLAGGLSAALPGAAGASHGSAGVGTGVTNVTNVTSVTSGAATCAEPAARSYIVDVLSGFAAGSDGVAASGFITGWETDHPLPAPPVVVEMLSAIGPPDATGGRTVSKQLVVLYPPAPKPGKTSAPGSVPASVKVVAPARAGRISWREVANWRELHDAVKK